MSCPCCRPPASEYRRFFSRRQARRDARYYRKRGLAKSARGLVELAGDVSDASVLDIGGGIGTLGVELLERGAARATTVEISDTYDAAAADLLSEHELGDRTERRIGDFVADEGLVEPADVVVMHRVVCCYPDADALVATAATHARRSLLLTYPQERRLTRFAFATANLALRLILRCGFRAYVHPFASFVAAAEREGLVLKAREPLGIFWENAAFERPTA
jgi:2-polyprenyl-3-methyl-5-hydroxy-6-metoxy-1,4-benzoquinol methylase